MLLGGTVRRGWGLVGRLLRRGRADDLISPEMDRKKNMNTYIHHHRYNNDAHVEIGESFILLQTVANEIVFDF